MIEGSRSRSVLVILDPEFAERLLEVEPGRPVWIVASPANDPVVQRVRSARPGLDHLTGVTRMAAARERPEDTFLSYLATIDLHHGPHSTQDPYREIEVIGCAPTARLRDALMEMGLIDIRQTESGFVSAKERSSL